MYKKILVAFTFLLQISGCATTQGGKGFDLVDDNEYAKALPFFEAAAIQDGSIGYARRPSPVSRA